MRLQGWVMAVGLALAAPALAGPPFRTDDPVPVDLGHFEINLFSTGIEAAAGWAGVGPGLEVNYGAAAGLQLHAILPEGFTSPASGRTGLGAGDLELGFKYRFLDAGDDDWWPQAALFPTMELPVGNQALGFSTGHVQLYLPLWLQKSRGAWTLYGGGGYWINPGAGGRDYAFYGVALWRQLSAPLNMGAEIFNQTAATEGGKTSPGFNIGATYDFSANWHLLASVGTGLANRTATNRFAYYTALQLTF